MIMTQIKKVQLVNSRLAPPFLPHVSLVTSHLFRAVSLVLLTPITTAELLQSGSSVTTYLLLLALLWPQKPVHAVLQAWPEPPQPVLGMHSHSF